MTSEQRMAFLKNKPKQRIPLAVMFNKCKITDVGDKFEPEIKKLTQKIIPRLCGRNINLPATIPKVADALARHMVGESQSKVGERINANAQRIKELMKIAFPDRKEMEQVLEQTLLGNAMLASAVFAEKAEQLSPRDAALSAGIFAQRFLEVKRDREGKPPEELNVNLVVKLQSTLHGLKELKNAKVIERT